MQISNVGKEAHLRPLQHGRHVICVNGRVAPSFVIEAACLVQVLEETPISFIAKDRESGQLEIVVHNAHHPT